MKTIVDLTEELKKYSLEKDTAAKQAVEANIAPVEADASSASRAYVVGEQLFLNDVLYDVTSPISVGDAIVVNTNITIANKLSADIKSKIDDLYSKNQTLTNKLNNEAATRSAMGAKNLIPFDLASIKAKNSQDYPSGSWHNNEWTINGVTFAIQDDNTVVATGSNTSNSNAQLDYYITIKGGVPYIANGCPSGGSYTTYEIANYCLTSPVETFHDLGNGVVITREAKTDILVHMQINAGYTIDGQLVFKPMVRLASDTDDTYEPYAKTNQQLTKETTGLIDNTEVNGAVNMLPNNATTQVINGVTFTVNDDGTVIANGTATAIVSIQLVADVRGLTGDKIVKVSGCPEGSTIISNKPTYCFLFRDSTGTLQYVTDTGWIGKLVSSYGTSTSFNIRIASGVTVSNLTFKPMITVPSYTGPYVPYAKTNKELTDESKLITLPATKNDSIVDSFVIRVRKQHNAVYVTGYLNITVAANRNDLLFTISELNFFDADDKFYIQMMSSDGDIAFAEVFSNGEVKVGKNTGMPIGYYMVDSVLLIK